MKKLIVAIISLIMVFAFSAQAVTLLQVPQGGTGVGSVTTGSYLKGAGTGALVPRTVSEVKTDLSLNSVENTALSTWAGTTNVTTLGTIAAGTWNGTALTDANVSNTLTVDGYMQDTDIDTFAELQSWAVGYTDNDTTYVSSDFTHDDLTGFVANEHIDWTGDQGATNIHSGNYTDTNTQLGGEEVDDFVNALLKDADSVNTRITLTYDDINNAFDFVVDDMNDDVPDAGDFGAATDLDANGALNTGSVSDNEIDYANVTLADFDYQTAWRVFYSDTAGDVTELALGADGTYLKSNGAAAAPTWASPSGAGDITDVFDCASGDCSTMTVGTSEYLTYGTGYIDANRFAGVTTVDSTEFGYLNGLTAAIVQTGSASHDGFSDYVANEHIDWTADQGATNIHSGNYTAGLTNLTDFDQTAWRLFYSNNLGDVIELSLGTDGQYLQSQGGTSSLTWSVPTNTTYTGGTGITLTGTVFSTTDSEIVHDNLSGFVANEHLDWTGDLGAVNIHAGNYTDTNTTYLGGTNLTLAGTTFNVDDAFVINSGSDIIGGGSGFTHTFNASAGSDSVFTFGDGTVNLSTGALQVGGNAVLTGNETITLSGDVAGSGATAITTTIGANKVLESHLKVVDVAADEECLTYEATTGDFEWQACGGSLAINDITDITIDTPADNEVLAYNNGTSTWLNQTPAEAGLQSVLTNSAGLLAALNDETGTGLSVFSTSPTFTTPLLGTPTSGVLTNCIGLPEAGLVDNAVTLAKMAHGTDGNLITYDVDGAPAAVATGDVDQVLTSNGIGAAPTFQAAAGGAGDVGGLYGINVETLSADKTLTVDTDKIYQYLDEGGANRIITLATAGASAGDRFVIRHNGNCDDNHVLYIKQGSTYLDGIYSGSVREFIFDGTNWISGENGTSENDNKRYNLSLGYLAKGYSSGVSIGFQSSAYQSGVGIGANAKGSLKGVGIGYNAIGSTYGVALGYGANTNDKKYSVALGYYSETERYSEIAHCIDGSGTQDYNFSIAGWAIQTANATPVEMFLGETANQRFTINPESAVNFVIRITARDNVANEVASYKIEGLIKRDGAGNTVLSWSSKTVQYEDDASWDVAVTADDTNEALIITVTGDGTNPVRFAGRIDEVETQF